MTLMKLLKHVKQKITNDDFNEIIKILSYLIVIQFYLFFNLFAESCSFDIK